MDVSPLAERQLTLSVRRLSEEFGMARETVTKRLANSNVRPAGSRQGHPVYRIKDAAQALLDSSMTGADGEIDPAKLSPQDRNAWYQAEGRRVDLEARTGQLIPAGEVHEQFALLVKTVNGVLDTLPDTLERDKRITPAQVEYVIAVKDQLKRDLVRMVTEEDPAEDVRVSR